MPNIVLQNLALKNATFIDTSLTTSTVTNNSTYYTNPGTYTWTCPANVYNVSVVCVGGGGGGLQAPAACSGGAGGGLGYKNFIPVIPGQNYTVVVGGGGAVRIIWGTGRAYPSTLTTDQ